MGNLRSVDEYVLCAPDADICYADVCATLVLPATISLIAALSLQLLIIIGTMQRCTEFGDVNCQKFWVLFCVCLACACHAFTVYCFYQCGTAIRTAPHPTTMGGLEDSDTRLEEFRFGIPFYLTIGAGGFTALTGIFHLCLRVPFRDVHDVNYHSLEDYMDSVRHTAGNSTKELRPSDDSRGSKAPTFTGASTVKSLADDPISMHSTVPDLPSEFKPPKSTHSASGPLSQISAIKMPRISFPSSSQMYPVESNVKSCIEPDSIATEGSGVNEKDTTSSQNNIQSSQKSEKSETDVDSNDEPTTPRRKKEQKDGEDDDEEEKERQQRAITKENTKENMAMSRRKSNVSIMSTKSRRRSEIERDRRRERNREDEKDPVSVESLESPAPHPRRFRRNRTDEEDARSVGRRPNRRREERGSSQNRSERGDRSEDEGDRRYRDENDGEKRSDSRIRRRPKRNGTGMTPRAGHLQVGDANGEMTPGRRRRPPDMTPRGNGRPRGGRTPRMGDSGSLPPHIIAANQRRQGALGPDLPPHVKNTRSNGALSDFDDQKKERTQIDFDSDSYGEQFNREQEDGRISPRRCREPRSDIPDGDPPWKQERTPSRMRRDPPPLNQSNNPPPLHGDITPGRDRWGNSTLGDMTPGRNRARKGAMTPRDGFAPNYDRRPPDAMSRGNSRPIGGEMTPGSTRHGPTSFAVKETYGL